MSNLSFVDKLSGAIERHRSLLCVGLDPDPHQFPQHFPSSVDAAALVAWGQSLIEQTADLVCCYKPNFAFYEQYGPAGLEALRQTIALVPGDVPVLLDAKRGDIGSTATAYARAAFEVWGADAITVNPYLGRDSISPFLAYPGKMVFVLGYTSNPSALEIQEFGGAEGLLYEHVIRQGQSWGSDDQLGYVIGATQPHALARFRQLTPGRAPWVLAPGIGAQAGDLTAALTAGLDRRGQGMIVPVSRGVIYVSDPRAVTLALRDEINGVRAAIKPVSPEVSPHTDLILQLHETGCVRFGNFTLASGKQSPIYLDLRRLMSRPTLLRLAAQAYAQLLEGVEFDRLAAVPYAALTIGTAVALATDRPLIYPRKEVKEYGTGQTVEGAFSPGETAIVIEDLVTKGGSALKAINALEAVGLRVAEVVVLIDREEGGREILQQAGYRLQAALKLSQILDTLQQHGRITAEQVQAVKTSLST
ncbi:MAG: orotidine-5'-phosphate decarboxylase [Anaerolineae bacterium]